MRRLLIILPLLLAACDPPEPRLTGSGMDMFAPVSIRLHPLTRILPAPPIPTTTTPSATAPATQTAEPRTPVLDARIELSDQFSDPTKSPGTITLELHDQPPLTHKGPLLQSWTFSIDQPAKNRDHWDRTTRTYLFRLPLTTPLPPRDHLLATVTLTLPNGATLTDELELPLK